MGIADLALAGRARLWFTTTNLVRPVQGLAKQHESGEFWMFGPISKIAGTLGFAVLATLFFSSIAAAQALTDYQMWHQPAASPGMEAIIGFGDVKLMAGIGAWCGWQVTFYAFCVSTVVGAIMAVIMVAWTGAWKKHYENFLTILSEWTVIKNPYELSKIAAERKPTMFLLPYGIPICIGTIGYFMYAGMM